MIDVSLLGERIRQLRRRKGWTQSAFADILCVSYQAVSNWERGIAPPDLDNLVKLASCFGVSVDALLSPMGEDLYLGVDGGGTKTEFAVVSSAGFVLKRVTTSGCNPNDIGFDGMQRLIMDGIGALFAQFPSIKGIFCGIAGVTAGDKADELREKLKGQYPKAHIQVDNDAFNLFALSDGADLAIISGTGSILFARSGGDYHRIGGWGHLFDRAGSAYDIGRDAVCAALEEEDLHKEPSRISRMLLEKMGAASVWDHITTLYARGKPYIAGFAPLVFEAYEAGDEAAVQIIDSNAKGLAKLLEAGKKLYNTTPIATASGGIFEHYSDILLKHIGKYSSVQLIVSELPPVYGACRSACEAAKCQMSDCFYENFKKTYGGANI